MSGLLVLITLGANARDCPKLGDSAQEAVRYLRLGPACLEPECVGRALRTLAFHRYASIAPLAARYLGYEAPPKTRLIIGLRDIARRFPASTTLIAMGSGAVTALIDVLRSDETSPPARRSALYTLVMLHRSQPELIEGIRKLRGASIAEKDPVAAGLLSESAQKAAEWCAPERKTSCDEAAMLGQ